MRVLWLCNIAPGKVLEARTGRADKGGLWVDHVLSGLRDMGMQLQLLFPGDGFRGALDERCGYASFQEGLPYRYRRELEVFFAGEIQRFQPDVIDSWGTESGRTLAMVNAAERLELLDRTVISIQGLCAVYARHYAEGLPWRVQRGSTFRDWIRRDNILQQQQKFARRGALEVQALRKARHVIGRTDWDEACTRAIQPGVQYHFCNETLREPFYQGQWRYEQCRKHRIFASSCAYPVKGFHYLLEAFADIVRDYPDATLAVPGKSFLTQSPLRESAYQRYLARLVRRNGLEEQITFLGSLNAQQMKAAFLEAQVFVLPSTIENSPNSLGEAMVLGLPCVAADVGGVRNLLRGDSEGLIYPSTEPYMLAYDIRRVFRMEERAEELGQAARAHALKTHSPEANLQRLLEIYGALAP